MAIEVRRGGEFLRAKTRWWKRILFRRTQIWAAGATGEALVRDELARLSDRFFIVHDVVHGRDGANVDHIVVGPRGIVAIETKYYHAEVRGREDGSDWRRRPVPKSWWRGGPWTAIPDPTQQVRRSASRIEAFLEQHAGLGLRVAELQLRVAPVVVFAHPRGRIRVKGRTVRIISLAGLRRVVKRGARTPIPLADRKAIAKAFGDWGDRRHA